MCSATVDLARTPQGKDRTGYDPKWIRSGFASVLRCGVESKMLLNGHHIKLDLDLEDGHIVDGSCNMACLLERARKLLGLNSHLCILHRMWICVCRCQQQNSACLHVRTFQTLDLYLYGYTRPVPTWVHKTCTYMGTDLIQLCNL